MPLKDATRYLLFEEFAPPLNSAAQNLFLPQRTVSLILQKIKNFPLVLKPIFPAFLISKGDRNQESGNGVNKSRLTK